MPYGLIRSALFCMDAEAAHEKTLAALERTQNTFWQLLWRQPRVQDPVTLAGLTLPNRVGLAAGLDKNGVAIDAFAALGFGFIEVGTVTPRSQAGNPQPRLFRAPEHRAIVNRMGFNNGGIDALVANVKRAKYTGILGINIGKNADTPIERAAEDYLACMEKAYPYASYITINISSPNTKNLRSLQGGEELDKLLGSLKEKQAQLAQDIGHYVPLAVKIAPDLEETEIAAIAEALRRHEIDGAIATNTTVNKTALGTSPLAQEAGGLSGEPVREPSNRVLSALAGELGGSVPLIGAGGILSAEDAAQKMRLGASAVQLYSGLVYRGPALVRECLRALV